MTIRFYKTTDQFGAFSNFSRHPVTINGKVYPTTEHWFQSQKFAGTPHEEEVRQAATPALAAKMGRDRARPLRSDWEEVKIDIMKEGLLAKFTQHDKLKKLLLSTCNERIIEHTVNDSYWGDGGDGRGENMLGQLLEWTRDQIAINDSLCKGC